MIASLIYRAKDSRWLLWVVLLLITLAELVTSVASPQWGLIMHAGLLVALTLYGAFGELSATRRLALALTLAPLIRLLSLSLPLIRFPQAAWYPIVAVPLLLAAWVVVRILGLPRQAIGVRLGALPLQLMLVGGGLGLGAIEYAILRPTPMASDYSWPALILPALSLVIFTGFTEEVIFRGLLQTVAAPALGRWALLYVALLFAVLHIGYLSVADVAFVFAVGLLFGEIVRRGGSILGVTLAHGMTNVTLFLVMPYLSANPATRTAAAAPWLIWGGSALALVAVNMLVLRGVVVRMPLPGARPAAGSGAVAIPNVAWLRLERRQRGLTYTDLAQRTGLPSRILAEIEHGMRLPQAEHLQLIVQALGAGAPTAIGV